MAYLRFAEVRRRVGLSRTTIWRLESRGLFVKRRRLSAHAVGWPEDEIEAWLRSRGNAAGGSPSAAAESTPPTILQWLGRLAQRHRKGRAASKRPARRSSR